MVAEPCRRTPSASHATTGSGSEVGTYSGEGSPVRASAFSAGRNRLATAFWLLTPDRSVGICENQRSGRLPPAVSFMTAPKPAADGNTGSQVAVGAPSTPAMSSWTDALHPLAALPRERQLDRGPLAAGSARRGQVVGLGSPG